jgi:hypothetical protein
MNSLRCILFNDHKIIERKIIGDDGNTNFLYCCSRCGKEEKDIISNYNNLPIEEILKLIKKTI